jgi:hypothetical protein
MEDDLHYACADVAGPRQAVIAAVSSEQEADLSMDSLTGSSSWEVTRKPKIRTRASHWV